MVDVWVKSEEGVRRRLTQNYFQNPIKLPLLFFSLPMTKMKKKTKPNTKKPKQPRVLKKENRKKRVAADCAQNLEQIGLPLLVVRGSAPLVSRHPRQQDKDEQQHKRLVSIVAVVPFTSTQLWPFREARDNQESKLIRKTH